MARPIGVPLSQAPLTAGSSDQLPALLPETQAQQSHQLSSWGATLAPWIAPDVGDPSDSVARSTGRLTAGSTDPEDGGLATSLRELFRRGRDRSLQPQASSGWRGQRDPLASGLGLSREPLCSCALCLGMAVGARRELIDRFGGRRSGQDRDQAAAALRPAPAEFQAGGPVGFAAAPLAAATPIATALTIADTDVFNLETNPGASKTIYLNFLGANLNGTAWRPAGSTWDGLAPAFTLDGDTSTNFSAAELAAIKEIFARVACDYAPFNVNVTTKAPTSAQINRSSSSDSVYGTVCLFSNISSQTGYSGAGGVAYVGVFNSVNAEYYKPALVFPSQLANAAKYIAEAASHEIGHNLNLGHDGTSTSGYYSGQGSSPGWAPIMGVGYYKSLTQFSRGTYSGANNTENDFTRIAGEGVGYWQDFVGNDSATAQLLALADGDGDGVSDKLQIGGSIELTASDGLGAPDQDFYGFLAPSNGDVTINVRNALYYFDPAVGQYTYAPVASGFGNLRLDARLHDASGTVLADWNQNGSLDVADFSVSGLVGGQNYYLSILSNANSPDGEDTYGSVGDYVFDLVYQGQPPVQLPDPIITLSLLPASVDEDAGASLIYSFSRTGSTDAPLTVAFNVTGSATAGSDYSGVAAGAGSLQFAAGASTATLEVTPLADGGFESNETVVVSLVNSADYSLATPSSVSGTIRNDDLPPTYTLSGATSLQEGQALAIGIATTNVADGTSFNWRLSGSGLSASDVAPAALSGSVTVDAGAGAVALTVVADNAIENTETALFELLNGSAVVASRSISLLDTNRLWGSTASDTITGANNRFERLSGVVATGTTAAALGTGQLDVVTGGIGADEFLLSETRSGALRVFYNDNTNNRTGTADHLKVLDFNRAEDKLRFASGRYFSRNTGSDTWIWYDRNNNGALNTNNGQSSSDELIAILTGVSLGSATLTSTGSPTWAVFG